MLENHCNSDQIACNQSLSTNGVGGRGFKRIPKSFDLSQIRTKTLKMRGKSVQMWAKSMNMFAKYLKFWVNYLNIRLVMVPNIV